MDKCSHIKFDEPGRGVNNIVRPICDCVRSYAYHIAKDKLYKNSQRTIVSEGYDGERRYWERDFGLIIALEPENKKLYAIKDVAYDAQGMYQCALRDIHDDDIIQFLKSEHKKNVADLKNKANLI